MARRSCRAAETAPAAPGGLRPALVPWRSEWAACRARGLRWLPTAVLLIVITNADAADPQPYTVTLRETGQTELDAALKDVSNLLSLQEGAPVGPFALVARAREDSERFVSALRSFGYYDGKVSVTIGGKGLDDAGLLARLDRAPADPPIPVLVAVELGPLFRLRKIVVEGDAPADVRAELGLSPGAPAAASLVLAAHGRLIDLLRQKGHALARVDPPIATLYTADKVLDITFKVDAGPSVDLGKISVTGADRMRDSFLEQRLMVSPGEPFNPEAIEKARQDLSALGVFSSVRARPADALDEQGRLPIEFSVTERPQRVASISGAYSTDIGGSAGVSWRHRNLLGSAEQLNLSIGISQLGGNSTIGVGYNGAITFIKPDWLQREQSFQASLGAVKQHFDAFDQTAASTGVLVNRRFSEHWGGSLGLAGEQETITQQGTTSDYTLLSLPATLKYDDTDNLLDPTEGIRAAGQFTPTQPLAGRISQPFALSQVAASTYFDIADPGRSIVALRGLIGYAIGVSQFDLPADKRYYAGGSATVRGFRFQSVGPRFPDNRPQGGTAVAAGTVEFRQRFFEDYGAVAFVDAGQVSANGAPFTAGWRIGAGLGARYYTSLGPIRIDVAVPVTPEANSGSFELYLGLGQAF